MDLCGLRLYEKATRKLGRPGLGSDTYDMDRGVTSHIVWMGQTLCGVVVGSEDRGWFRNVWTLGNGDVIASASCKRCRRSVPKHVDRLHR